MPVVVTGAAGFVGGHAVRELLERGVDVVAVDREPVRVPPAAELVALRACLTEDEPLVAAALRSADAVLHLAGCPGVRDARADVAWCRERDNVRATARVLRSVPLATPVVVASSSSVYGGTADGAPCAEDAPLRPRGGYAASKAAAEAVCAARAAEGGRTTVVRPFTVAGEGQREDMALTRWLRAARAGRPLLLHGGPDRTRDLTDVRDVARLLVRLLELGATTTTNLGTGRAVPLGAMVDAVAAATGRPVTTRVVAPHPDEVRDTLADVRHLERLVGEVPQTDLEALVRRQADALAAADAREPVPA